MYLVVRDISFRRRIARRLALAVFVIAICPGLAQAQTTVNIDIFSTDFGGDFGNFQSNTHVDPTINVGDTIQWTLINGFHTTTSAAGQLESWDSGFMSVTDPNNLPTFTHTFTQAGTFYYYCQAHGRDNGDGTVSGMSGFITVIAPVPEPAFVLLIAAVAGGLAWCWRKRAPIGARLRITHAVAVARPAFTLVETLVVIAILGVVVGMMLPAVQKAREAANYGMCRNNLRQIGMAIQHYEVNEGFYPGIGIAPQQDSVLARLLPYLELSGVQNRINTDRPLFNPRGDYGFLDSSQAEAARTVVRRFLCPSDSHAPTTSFYDMATLAGTNYVVNAGTGTDTYYDFRYPTDGLFWYGSQLRLKDITDGTSSTMFVSEALLGTGSDVFTPSAIDPRRHWVTAMMTFPAPDGPGTNPPLTDDMAMMTMLGMTWRGDRNISWIGGPGQRSVFNTYLMPNDTMLDYGAYGLGRFKASSNHLGGVNIVLGDGSVHFIRNQIDMMMWRSLSTRHNGDSPGAFCGCH